MKALVIILLTGMLISEAVAEESTPSTRILAYVEERGACMMLVTRQGAVRACSPEKGYLEILTLTEINVGGTRRQCTIIYEIESRSSEVAVRSPCMLDKKFVPTLERWRATRGVYDLGLKLRMLDEWIATERKPRRAS